MSVEALIDTLVEQAATTEGWPDPKLLAEILARGSEAVGPLRMLLKRDFEEWPEIETYVFAAELLGCLGDPAAIPDLLSLFRRLDDEVLETLSEVLGEFGRQIIEPALEIARDDSRFWYPRSAVVDAARTAAGEDADARARIAEVMREILADCLKKSEEADATPKVASDIEADVSDEDDDDNPEDVDDFEEDEDEDTEHDFVEMASMAVSALSRLADPLARDLIDAAYKADIVEGFTVSREDVEQAYREGPKTRSRERAPFLSRYEDEYEDHQNSQRRRAEQQALRLANPPIMTLTGPPPRPPVVETIRKTNPRPGRNEPCWCGSGKKYKQCHLRADEA